MPVFKCFAVISGPLYVNFKDLPRPNANCRTDDHEHFLVSDHPVAKNNGPYCLRGKYAHLHDVVVYLSKKRPKGLPDDTDDWQRATSDLHFAATGRTAESLGVLAK